MFEKEAEEAGNEKIKGNYQFARCARKSYKDGFKDGAEFGYNKANEWHKVADGDLPKENKLYLVQIKDNGLAIAYFNGRHWETRYNLGEFGHCVETVIAWCEIPTFEEIEENA